MCGGEDAVQCGMCVACVWYVCGTCVTCVCGSHICVAEEVCDAFLDTPMILELWDVSPLLALKTHNIIFNHRKSNHVIWGNKFSTEIQRNCEDLDAIIPTFNTATQWILIYVCYYLGALP